MSEQWFSIDEIAADYAEQVEKSARRAHRPIMPSDIRVAYLRGFYDGGQRGVRASCGGNPDDHGAGVKARRKSRAAGGRVQPDKGPDGPATASGPEAQ